MLKETHSLLETPSWLLPSAQVTQVNRAALCHPLVIGPRGLKISWTEAILKEHDIYSMYYNLGFETSFESKVSTPTYDNQISVPLLIKYFISPCTIKGKKPQSMTIISLHSLSARLAILLWAPIAVSRCVGQIQA